MGEPGVRFGELQQIAGMIRELEAGNAALLGLNNDTDETFETEMTRRDNPFRAYITIIEGCDKACAYCVVPSHARTGTQPREQCKYSGKSAASPMRATPKFSCSGKL